MDTGKLEAKILGQLLLMQNIVINLPDLDTILSFVCQGLKDIPGVQKVVVNDKKVHIESDSKVYITIEQNETCCGVLEFQLNNPEEYYPYHNYVSNFVFMLGIILEEREQRAKNEEYQEELQEAFQKQREAYEEIETVNEELNATNEELYEKNTIIEEKNEELELVIKHLKETQSQLLQVEKMASLGTLTAGVSHEINNPLQYLSGIYYGLENYFKEYGSQNEKTTTYLLSSTKTAIDRISAIVKGLNQFSRNNASMDEECNIHSILDNCVTMLYNQTKHKIEIHKNFSENLLTVQGNVGQLHQVFINILTNSIQAIIDTGEINIKTYKKGKEINIEFIDTGCGIKKLNLSKITEPFFTTKDAGQGTGLGLSIAYSILKDHKGNIQFESEEGKGTRVIVSLPQKIKK